MSKQRCAPSLSALFETAYGVCAPKMLSCIELYSWKELMGLRPYCEQAALTREIHSHIQLYLHISL